MFSNASVFWVGADGSSKGQECVKMEKGGEVTVICQLNSASNDDKLDSENELAHQSRLSH